MSAKRAIIMAAGTSDRFVPNSLEYPKGLAVVKGEVLIERQIRQLKEAGVKEIIIVTGYKAELFKYLSRDGIKLVHNQDFDTRNNHSSLYYVRDHLANAFICSADNYFNRNPFLFESDKSYYSAVYHSGETSEWVIEVDENDRIVDVTIGGQDGWVMLGHVYFDSDFGLKFKNILEQEFNKTETTPKYWENLLIEHLDELEIYIRRFDDNVIFEFDSLDELREFDESYWEEPQSDILDYISKVLKFSPKKFHSFVPLRKHNHAIGFRFRRGKKKYVYFIENNRIMKNREYKKWKKSRKKGK